MTWFVFKGEALGEHTFEEAFFCAVVVAHADIQRSVVNQNCNRAQSAALEDFRAICFAGPDDQHLFLSSISNIQCSAFSHKDVPKVWLVLDWDLSHDNRFKRLSWIET